MREPFCPSNNNTTENTVPLPPHNRRSKRKMDQRRLGIRGLFKNPPQPHMCVQDTLLGSREPCFVNVLSWDKISMPAHPKDPIPLYGGIRIFNNSMNSLSFTTSYNGCTPGRQPVIFAVLANTEILKFSGKTAKDPNERDALIYLILDFIEVMNDGVHFAHQFTVVPNRDVVGELKDIWFIIQNKREQERLELYYNGEGDRAATDRLNQTPKSHKRDAADGPENLSGKESWLCSGQEKEKVTRSHSYPGGYENRSGLELQSAGMSHDAVSRPRNIICLDSMTPSQGDEEEVVLFEHDYVKVIPLERPSVSLYDYFPSSLKTASIVSASKDHYSTSTASTGLPPSYNDAQNNVSKFASMKPSYAICDQVQATDNKENTYLPSFTDISRGRVLDQEETKLTLAVNSVIAMSPGVTKVTFDSFDSEGEEELFDQVRRVVATEILPSLDSLETENVGTSFVSKTDSAFDGIYPKTFITTAEMVPHCSEINIVNRTIECAAEGDTMCVVSSTEKVPHGQKVIDVQLSNLAEVLDNLDEHFKAEASSNSNIHSSLSTIGRGNMSLHNDDLEQFTSPLETCVKPLLGPEIQSYKDRVNSFDESNSQFTKTNGKHYQSNAAILPSSDLLEANVQDYLLNKVNLYVPRDKRDSNENVEPCGNGNTVDAITSETMEGPSSPLPERLNTTHLLIDGIDQPETLNSTDLDPENNVTHLNYDIPCIATLGINNTIKANNHTECKSSDSYDAIDHQ